MTFSFVAPEAVCAFDPLWSEEVKIKRNYLTTILTAEEGNEQRSGLTNIPTISISYTIQPSTQAKAGYLRRRLQASVNKVWNVPLWPHEMVLTSQASSGTNTLNVDSADYRDLSNLVSGEVMIRHDYNTYEIGEISSFSSTQIVLKDNLASTWAAGKKVYPLIRSTLGTAVDLERPTTEHSKIGVEFSGTFRSET